MQSQATEACPITKRIHSKEELNSLIHHACVFLPDNLPFLDCKSAEIFCMNTALLMCLFYGQLVPLMVLCFVFFHSHSGYDTPPRVPFPPSYIG